MGGWMDTNIDEQLDGQKKQMDGWVYRKHRRMVGWMNRKNGWLNGQKIDEWLVGRITKL